MLDIQKYIGTPKIIFEEIDDNLTKYVIQNLPRGFGHSLGNALRRILLWYSYAGAITGLKIKSISHEYSVLTGVKESVIDIILNIKELRYKPSEYQDKYFWVDQKFTKPGKYYAKNLKVWDDVEILNPDLYLFEITDATTPISMDIRFEKWYWYYSIEYLRNRENKNETIDSNLILIDNDFQIVEYVKYDVQEQIDNFIGGNKDVLNLEIKSISPAITPKELLMFAGEVLSHYAQLFAFDDVYMDMSAFIEDETILWRGLTEEEMNIKTMPIDALPLSERTRNALIKNEILYVEDLEKKRRVDLQTMKWVWKKAVDEIIESLRDIGKSLVW
jgi:DNA-directed RNA polymerase subunit alpha